MSPGRAGLTIQVGRNHGARLGREARAGGSGDERAVG